MKSSTTYEFHQTKSVRDAVQLDCSDGAIITITESESNKFSPESQEKHAGMGSSATSPNISPPSISPQTTRDIDHNIFDQSTAEFKCDSMLRFDVSSNSQQHSDLSSIIMSAFDKHSKTQNSPPSHQTHEQKNSQKVTLPDERLSKVNSKSGSNVSILSLPNKNDEEAVHEKIKDEEDKYPCLRRALSCTETPILPLGTYAVEFGFDVCSLPFKSINKPVPVLFKNQGRGVSACLSTSGFTKSSGESGVQEMYESQSPKKCVSKIQYVEEQSEEQEKQLESEISTASTRPSHLPADKETATSNHSKRFTQNKQSAKATGSCTDSVRVISSKRSKRDNGNREEAVVHDENVNVRKTVTKDNDKKNEEDELKEQEKKEIRKTDKEHSVNIAKTGTSSITSEDPEQLDSDSTNVFEESYWYATKWKKDNRKWLWKCSRRTRHETLACNAMSRRYRRSSSVWLLKPSSKQT